MLGLSELLCDSIAQRRQKAGIRYALGSHVPPKFCLLGMPCDLRLFFCSPEQTVPWWGNLLAKPNWKTVCLSQINDRVLPRAVLHLSQHFLETLMALGTSAPSTSIFLEDSLSCWNLSLLP